MTAYKIKRIYIENFKPINQALFDFSEKNLVMLDGPNGFGKTSIFDAIELVLRGRVSRVLNTADGRLGYNDLLFSKNKNKDTIIKIEFYKEIFKDNTIVKEYFTIAKKYDSSNPLNPSDRKPDNWDLFETHLLENFEDIISKESLLDTQSIYSKYRIGDFSRYFSLFYYVQQEENTHFLKKSGKDRMNEISQLFDTYNEQSDKEKFEKMKRELDKEKRKITGNSGLLKTKKQLLLTLTSGLQDFNDQQLIEIDYFQLIPGLTTIREWDKINITPQKETRELFIDELLQLKDFVENFDEFLKSQNNKLIQEYSENKQLLQDSIVISTFLNDFSRLTELKHKERKLRFLKSNLTKETFSKNITIINLKDLEFWVDLEMDWKTINTIIQLLIEYKTNTSSLSGIVNDLNLSRDSLLEHFGKLIQHDHDNENSCPVCGHIWETQNILMSNIKVKGEALQNFYDTYAEKFNNQMDILYNEYFTPIISWIDNYLSNSDNIMDNDFFDQLKDAYDRKQIVESFLDWCDKHDIDLKEFLNEEQKFVQELESREYYLAEFLKGKKQSIKDGYTEYDDKTSTFETLYKDLFNSNEFKVLDITYEEIERKIQYIDYQYFHRSSETIVQLEVDVQQLETRLEQVNNGISHIQEIINIYSQRISQHWKRIMRDIEIPFYIYSGKILQDYQKGLGLFIQESDGEGSKSIMFVSDSKSDHDAINYLSSGQLSALVISFTLALNKVYGNDSMDIILIDDPVQTMDEINTASFVELLRNEFKDKQILLSTHEEEISRYMRYKFTKYGLNTLRFNVKDRLFIANKENKDIDN